MFDSETAARSSATDMDFEPAVSAEAANTPRNTAAGSIVLVIVCTIIGAAAQILMRHGALNLHGPQTLMSLLMNWELMAGYACLGINTVLLVVALRGGELSILYPIIALTYVWVTILSPMFFDDVINPYKIAGVSLIVLGVSFIGLGSRS